MSYNIGMKRKKLEYLVGEALTRKRLTLAIAESVTGGLISDKITDLSGSSRFFLMSVIAYSNDAKKKLLGVPQKTLARYGAVSKETALLMATGVKKCARSDIGLSVTGIAGPTGGTRKKPIGLVYVGIDAGWIKLVKMLTLKGKRLAIKEKASCAALNLLASLLETEN